MENLSSEGVESSRAMVSPHFSPDFYCTGLVAQASSLRPRRICGPSQARCLRYHAASLQPGEKFGLAEAVRASCAIPAMHIEKGISIAKVIREQANL